MKMNKTTALLVAMAIALASAPAFAHKKGSAYPACKGMKGHERSECIKSEKAKKAEAKTAKPAETK